MSGEQTEPVDGGTVFDRAATGSEYRYDVPAGEPPSVAVARALAAVRAEFPHETTPQLYDYVDPDALDAMFAEWGSHAETTKVEFDVEERTVVVRGHGEVVVRG
ncbi:hypothetical protein G9464_05310 [Halostella sp. JP-L12]|uniref:HalOD1 output domain-containing protein n=1 Tax=Halostella TaxID=1843185 RepID=UPI0013CF1000|nr:MULTISPECIES: HalOD1 output domain-containing protein [Halostella]NHN47014.1 hypothetical protein [Halostella sp. JP-L12]